MDETDGVSGATWWGSDVLACKRASVQSRRRIGNRTLLHGFGEFRLGKCKMLLASKDRRVGFAVKLMTLRKLLVHLREQFAWRSDNR